MQALALVLLHLGQQALEMPACRPLPRWKTLLREHAASTPISHLLVVSPASALELQMLKATAKLILWSIRDLAPGLSCQFGLKLL